MTFFDIGAHIGEYALLGSRLVGPSGTVHAFEPQADTMEILRKNVEHNGLANVTMQFSAVAESDGFADFAVRSESSLSSILPSIPNRLERGVKETVTVPKCQLDTYCSKTGCSPHLIKVDVEGAELSVLQGACALLSMPPQEAPVWILEYSPETYSRFGYLYTDIIGLLEPYGYSLFGFNSSGGLTPVRLPEHRWDRSHNLVASKTSLSSVA